MTFGLNDIRLNGIQNNGTRRNNKNVTFSINDTQHPTLLCRVSYMLRTFPSLSRSIEKIEKKCFMKKFLSLLTGSPVGATTLSILTLGVRDLFVALSINNTEQKITQHNDNLV
jgi:hypothetical protein